MCLYAPNDQGTLLARPSKASNRLPGYGAPSKSVLCVPPSTKARLQTPRGGSVQYPMWLASLLVAPSAHSRTRPRTDSPCITRTATGLRYQRNDSD